MSIMAWSVAIIFFAFGTVAGIAVGYFLLAPNTRKTSELNEQLQSAKTEFDSYRDDVLNDYRKTASLVNEMTTSYRAVHEHLAKSAQNLCGDRIHEDGLDLLIQQLPREPGRTIEHSGEPVEPTQAKKEEAGPAETVPSAENAAEGANKDERPNHEDSAEDDIKNTADLSGTVSDSDKAQAKALH